MQQFPHSLSLNQAPPQLSKKAEPEQTNPAILQQPQQEIKPQPEPIPEQNNNTGDSIDDYIKEISGQRKFSADTVITQEDNGTTHVELPTGPMIPTRPPLSDSEALENTVILMEIRQSLQAMLLSWYVHGNVKQQDDFLYEKPQFDRLTRAWSRIIQRNGIRVHPALDVLAAEATCTGPLAVTAFEARKYRMALEKQERENRRLRKENAELKSERPRQLRRDTQTQWKIDDKGYFRYTESNVYIKDGMTKIRPDFEVQGTYELLCKHNGKEMVDSIYFPEK